MIKEIDIPGRQVVRFIRDVVREHQPVLRRDLIRMFEAHAHRTESRIDDAVQKKAIISISRGVYVANEEWPC